VVVNIVPTTTVAELTIVPLTIAFQIRFENVFNMTGQEHVMFQLFAIFPYFPATEKVRSKSILYPAEEQHKLLSITW